MKKTYFGTLKDGRQIARSSNNTYTHAVVWIRENGYLVEKSFCGSLELAERRSPYYDKTARKEIVPLVEAEPRSRVVGIKARQTPE
jgi:hypothetical protein